MNTETLDRLEALLVVAKATGNSLLRPDTTDILEALPELIAIARSDADVEGMHAAVCRATKIASLRKDPGEVISRHILGDAA